MKIKSIRTSCNNSFKAFTLIECLVGVWINLVVGLMIINVVGILFKYKNLSTDDTFSRWQSAMIQFKSSIDGKKIDKISHNQVVFKIDEQKIVFRKYQDQLVESKIMSNNSIKGYKPLLFNLKNIEFSKSSNILQLNGEFENGEKYKYYWKVE